MIACTSGSDVAFLIYGAISQFPLCFLQVKSYLQHNEELRNTLDKLRMEQANLPGLNDKSSQALPGSSRGDNTLESPYEAEFLSLKVCSKTLLL